MEKVITALLYSSCMLVFCCTSAIQPTVCGNGWMQSTLVPVDVLPFLLGEKSVGAHRKETFSWCVYALAMNTAMAISFKVPTLI